MHVACVFIFTTVSQLYEQGTSWLHTMASHLLLAKAGPHACSPHLRSQQVQSLVISSSLR